MRDRDSDLDTDSDAAGVAWDERPIVGQGRGLPWWAAVLLALGLTAAAAVVDRSRLVDDQRLTGLGIYHIAFLAGCLLAVLAVRRRNLFGPMVQPPLIFAVTFIAVQMTARTSTTTESGTRKFVFEVALPLASSFPWMAGATAATILLGVLRLFLQRDPNAVSRSDDDFDDADDVPTRREARPRRPAPDREERPARDRAPRDDDRRRTPREDRDDRKAARAAKADRPVRREPSNPAQRRPSRDDRGKDERPSRDDRGRGEPPRRNPPRPRDDRGGRSSQPRRRPREDDY